MIYHPTAHKRCLWDTWLFAEDGVFYLFALAKDAPPGPGGWDTFRLATSTDCVHWHDEGVILRKDPDADWMGTGHTWKAGDRYVTNFSECRNSLQSIRFAESADLRHWTVLGDEFNSEPDPRWYQSGHKGSPTSEPRWDCIYVVPAEEPDAGFIGFLTATADHGPLGRRGCAGCVRSMDGRTFEAVPPATPPGLFSRIEVGGVAKLGSHWYMAGSLPHSHLGERKSWPDTRVGTQYLVADRQAGPYRHPAGSNRLLSGPQWWTYFGRFFSHGGRVFFNHHTIPQCNDDAISLAPLKEVRETVSGQIALFWWPGNGALIGRHMKLTAADWRPHACGSVDPCVWSRRSTTLRADATGTSGAAWLDLAKIGTNGVVVDLALALSGANAAAGVYFGPAKHEGWALLLTAAGSLEVGPAHRDSMGWSFMRQDEIPEVVPRAAASSPWRLRILARRSFVEFYVNDRLLYALSLPWRAKGLGVLVEDGKASFADLAVHQMTLDA